MLCRCCVQAARVSADAVAAAVTLTNDCIKDGNAVEATSKAAASAWRSSQVRYCLPSTDPTPRLIPTLWNCCSSRGPKNEPCALEVPECTF